MRLKVGACLEHSERPKRIPPKKGPLKSALEWNKSNYGQSKLLEEADQRRQLISGSGERQQQLEHCFIGAGALSAARRGSIIIPAAPPNRASRKKSKKRSIGHRREPHSARLGLLASRRAEEPIKAARGFDRWPLFLSHTRRRDSATVALRGGATWRQIGELRCL